MKRVETPPILLEVRTASSPASQVKALKVLKNELIGHDQKKEQWVKLGLLTTLAQILSSPEGNAKNKDREKDDLDETLKGQDGHTDEDEARLQAVIVIGSLAYGGPAFVAPIYAAQIIPHLLSLLSNANGHHQMTLHVLKTLDTIANSISLSSSEQEENVMSLTTLFYSHTNLLAVSEIIQQTASAPLVQQQVALAASLIAKTCQNGCKRAMAAEYNRAMAAESGVLEALALAAAPLILDCLRYPFHAKAKTPLASILGAVKAVIGVIKFRGEQFLTAYDRGVPRPSSNNPDRYDTHIPSAINFTASDGPQDSLISIKFLLPQPPVMKGRGSSKLPVLPPTSQFKARDKQVLSPRSMSTAVEVTQRQDLTHVGVEESPLIELLIHIFRSSENTVSLAAAGLLVTFHRLGLTSRPKEPVFALLLVPSLVQMLSTDSKAQPHDPVSELDSTLKTTKAEASEILATVTNGCVETQNAAYDAGAIKKLAQLLKESFDTLPAYTSDQPWKADPTYSFPSSSREDTHRLGPPGIRLATYHRLRLREAVLTAFAAIASEKDEYRKAVIDNGVVPFVIKSLATEPEEEADPPNSSAPVNEGAVFTQQSTGSHRAVALAACGTARALSRSVSTLRTSLMDAGLPTPLFLLLKSQDIEIQIAVTGVLCNLVLKFSPMRDAIMEGGALKALCVQAHSTNPRLRLNSMWALKNIIAGASNPTKKSCLEELGPGWLKQIVAHDADDAPYIVSSRLGDRDDESSTLIRMGTPNAAGEQVDLLNAVEEDSPSSAQGLEENEEEDIEMADSIGALSKSDRDGKYPSATPIPDKQSPIALPSFEPVSRHWATRSSFPDEVAIQKEGLEFIRNLICGDQSPEMIDHLFRELGQDKVFEMLTSKLRPKILHAFRRSNGNGVTQVQQHPEILTSTCYTLVHIACGQPRHRQLLVSQTELLRLLLPLFNHVHREIRTCLCWIVINVTWVEDSTDEQSAKLRARELQKLGFVEKLDMLEADEVLDCRERAKNARDQIRRLVHV